jgi:hypothetical protein
MYFYLETFSNITTMSLSQPTKLSSTVFMRQGPRRNQLSYSIEAIEEILIKGLFIVIWQRLTVIIKEWSNWRLGVMRGWYYQGPSGARSLRNMGTWKEEPDGRERDAPISLTLITP